MLLAELLKQSAALGKRVTYDSHQAWLSDLPKNCTMHKSGSTERAQSFGKDFEGIAGSFDSASGKGWIYSYYLDKKNMSESMMADADAFCSEVEKIVKQQHGHDDGGDLCWNLIEQGVVDIKKHTPKQAAQIVAQHIDQA
jgi:hypothetical protein